MDTKAVFDRDTFESKLIEWWPQAKGNIIRDGDDYANHFMNYAWWGWKASREEIEIELPGQENYDDPLSAYLAIKDCAASIKSHGIRIKGKTE